MVCRESQSWTQNDSVEAAASRVGGATAGLVIVFIQLRLY